MRIVLARGWFFPTTHRRLRTMSWTAVEYSTAPPTTPAAPALICSTAPPNAAEYGACDSVLVLV